MVFRGKVLVNIEDVEDGTAMQKDSRTTEQKADMQRVGVPVIQVLI